MDRRYNKDSELRIVEPCSDPARDSGTTKPYAYALDVQKHTQARATVINAIKCFGPEDGRSSLSKITRTNSLIRLCPALKSLLGTHTVFS